MYKLIVVDDEKAIRKGICNYIDWGGLGFEVTASFEDGKETIEYIESHDVDVVLTDIEMAQVSGLELAKYIHDRQLPPKAVIISGYKEFEYARKAVEYGVEHYLLKPIKMEEVAEVFTKIRKDLDKKKENGHRLITEQRNFEELLPELREQFWISLLVGGPRAKEKLIKRKNLLKLDMDVELPCGILDIKPAGEDEELLPYNRSENYHNLINNIFGGISDEIQCYPTFLSADILKIIVTTCRNETADMFGKRLKLQIDEKCQSAYSLLKLKFDIKIEKIFKNLVEMSEYNCRLSSRAELEQSPDTRLLSEDYEQLIQKYKLLMGIINDGDFEELDNMIDNIFLEFRNLPIDQVKQISIDMFSMLSGKFVKMGIDFWKDMNKTVSYQQIMEAENLRELKIKCQNMLRATIDIVRSKQNAGSRSVVEQSLLYIKKHIGEDLSLEGIADRFFLNQTYFSRLFKQYTGTTFTDYLIEQRMEKAKELLSLGRFKVYEVSQMIGYRSEKYFFRIFKQYAGCSPAEYFRGRSLNDER